MVGASPLGYTLPAPDGRSDMKSMRYSDRRTTAAPRAEQRAPVPFGTLSSARTVAPSRANGLAFKAAFTLGLVMFEWGAFHAPALGQAPVLQGRPPTDAGQTDTSPGSNLPDTSGKTLEARLAEARAELAAALDDSSLSAAPTGASPQDVWLRRGLLQRLVRLYEQQLTQAAELESAKARKAEVEREAQAWTRLSEPLPYSILLADRLREDLQAERLKVSNDESAAAMLDQIMLENRGTLAESEKKIRILNEQLESGTEPARMALLSWQRDLERLRGHVAAATVAALDMERAVRNESLAASRIRVELLQRQLVVADAGAQFTQADLEKVIPRIERQSRQLERELAEAQNQRGLALRALEEAREELRSATGGPGAAPVAARAAELVSVREAQLEGADAAISILRLLLEGTSLERTMWELRFAASESRDVELLRDSEHRLAGLRRRLALWRDYARQQLDVSSSQLQLQERRVNSLPPESDVTELAQERLAALRERDRLFLRFTRGIEQLEHLTERWGESLRAAQGRLPLTGRIRNLFLDTRSFLRRLWTFEVFTAEDTITVDGQKITGRRGVTIGKIVTAVLILGVGYWVTGVIARAAEPIAIRRMKIEPNLARLIRRWLRFLLVACLVLFSLVSVKIPLTVFAFAGGALAIALGFGMQTLLKNFISGLIILFERPFRVGDVIDVGGQKGTVTEIGVRASVLELWDGTETLIPNSTLLENNLTNWTSSNRQGRFAVTVGVAYESEPRRVIQILSEVADRHGLVEKEPKRQILFTEFGDSTLNFELRFWVDVVKVNPAQVASDLRLMIAGALAENGVVVAFPQRDIRLHADRPIPVEVARMTGAPAGGPEGDDDGAPGTQPDTATNRG